MYANVVWEGRFQPIHLGHLSYVDRLLKYGRHVWIWVVANEQSDDVVPDRSALPVPFFTDAVDPHHRPEKNILPFWLRYRLVVETIREEFSDAPITVCGGRRLDLAWDLYQKILPPERAFLTPSRDSFEDVKARAWAELGEKCERIDVSDLPQVSATMVRERISEGRSISGLLAPYTIYLLRKHGYLSKLSEL